MTSKQRKKKEKDERNLKEQMERRKNVRRNKRIKCTKESQPMEVLRGFKD